MSDKYKIDLYVGDCFQMENVFSFISWKVNEWARNTCTCMALILPGIDTHIP